MFICILLYRFVQIENHCCIKTKSKQNVYMPTYRFAPKLILNH